MIEQFYQEKMELSMNEAVNEAWELSTWILIKFLGPVHTADMERVVEVVDNWSFSSTGDLFSRLNPELLPAITNGKRMYMLIEMYV